nr:MAG TPA: hypothetical protein [Caudoviricetes sp.]
MVSLKTTSKTPQPYLYIVYKISNFTFSYLV